MAVITIHNGDISSRLEIFTNEDIQDPVTYKCRIRSYLADYDRFILDPVDMLTPNEDKRTYKYVYITVNPRPTELELRNNIPPRIIDFPPKYICADRDSAVNFSITAENVDYNKKYGYLIFSFSS